MFIVGLQMLRGPAHGACAATRSRRPAWRSPSSRRCSTRGIGDWILIVVGVAIGTAVGVPAARSVKMTAMPQMVALFNGVGGGAVALISFVEFRAAGGDLALRAADPDPVRGDHRLDLASGARSSPS